MKTVILFPGLDSLFQASKLKRWLDIDDTKASLHEASVYLSGITGKQENLSEFLLNAGRPHMVDFDRTLVALTALQVGIARGIQKQYTWDLALGCSHGDIARSIITGVISYEHAVEILWAFAHLRKTSPKGYTANVRSIDGTPLTTEQLNWLESHGLPVSQWSDKNATVGGEEKHLEKITEEAEELNLKVRTTLPYPVHSPVMMPAHNKLRELAVGWTVNRPNCPVFSSVYCRYIKTSDELREEGLASSIEPVKWVPTLQKLVDEEGCTKFLNVGPSNTLTGWLFSQQEYSNIELIDGWDIVPSLGANGVGEQVYV